MTGLPAGTEPGSPRKHELLEAAYRDVLGHGLAGLSLRPLASQIRSSPRVLLFLFGLSPALDPDEAWRHFA